MDRSAPDVSYEVLLEQMPAAVRDALVVAPWTMQKLRALELPRREIQLTEFEWLLDLPLWQLDGVRFQVSPRMVLSDPPAFPHHVGRVDDADLDCPIHVMRRQGRWTVLDGFHRIAKALREGRTTIPAFVLQESDLQRIC